MNKTTLQFEFNGYLINAEQEGYLANKYSPFFNLVKNNNISYFTTKNLNFNINKPLDIIIQDSYDGSVNLIINDDSNRPRLINSRFSTKENDTYVIPDHFGNKDTSLYDDNSLEQDISLYKTVTRISRLQFNGLSNDGKMQCGTYNFYFKLCDNDNNETDFILESGPVMCHIGNHNHISSVRMGMDNEDSQKSISFTLYDLDRSYDFIKVYYTRVSSGEAAQDSVESYEITYKFPILNYIKNDLIITGIEDKFRIDTSEINDQFEFVSTVKTQAICQNHLFFGNIYKQDIPYRQLKDFSLRIIPSMVQNENIGQLNTLYNDIETDKSRVNGYYNPSNIYYRLGYWDDEYYRFGVVYIMNDFSLSPVFNIRGIDFSSKIDDDDLYKRFPYDEVLFDEDGYIIGTNNTENNFGLIRTKQIRNILQSNIPLGISFKYLDYVDQDSNIDTFDVVKKNIKGFFIVRQKRSPMTISQGIVIGKTNDGYGNIPCLKKDSTYIAESFLNDNGDLERSIVYMSPRNVTNKALLSPDAIVRQPLFNQIYTNSQFNCEAYAKSYKIDIVGDYKYIVNGLQVLDKYIYRNNILTMVNNQVKLTTNGNDFFAGKIGDEFSVDNFKSVTVDWSKFGKYPKNQKQPPVSFLKQDVNEFVSKDLNSDKFVRGIFGSYIGMSNSNIDFGTIINIRDKNNNNNINTKYNLEQIRRNINTPYYAVSERMYFDEIEKGIDCYRGDCFISIYTHRMMYNHTDPEFPTNENIVEKRSFSKNLLIMTKFYDPKTKVYINEIVPLFKAKVVTAESEETDRLKVFLKMLLPFTGAEKLVESDIDELLELDNEPLFFGETSKTKQVFLLTPEDGSYAEPDKASNKLGLVNRWTERGIDKVNRIDVNSVGLGHWFTFPILSNYNLAMRDIDFYRSQEESLFNKKRSFYPYENISIKSANKQIESNIINGATNNILSLRHNFLMPDVPYIKQQYDSRVLYSKTSVSDAFENGFRVFKKTDFKDLPKTYGALTCLKEYNGNLVAIMEHGILLVPVNERAIAAQGAGGNVYINNNNVLPDNPMVVSNSYGSTWRDSIIQTNNGIYGIDTFAKKIWKLQGNQLQTLSDFKLQKFLNDNINLKEWDKLMEIGIKDIRTHYNAFKKDVMFVFYNKDKSWNLCYNEYLDIFTTFYSWFPSLSENINNIFISFDLNDSKNIILSNNTEIKDVFESIEIDNKLPKDGKNKIIFKLPENYTKNDYLSLYDKFYNEDNKYVVYDYDKKELTYNENYINELSERKWLNIKLNVKNLDGNNGDYFLRLINEDMLQTRIWKHGQGGIIDGQGKILPTNWYDKQETFEFEFVVIDTPMIQKLFYNLLLISNRAAPDSFEYEVVGDSYDWFKFKKIINWANSKSQNIKILETYYKDILTNTQKQLKNMYSDYPMLENYPEDYTIKKIPFIRRVRKDSLGNIKDYEYEANSTEVWLIEDELMNEDRVRVNQKGNDIKKNGLIKGNMEYKEDTWNAEIRHITFKYAYIDKQKKLRFSKLNESRIRDKFCKIRIRYSGKDLVILQGIKTMFEFSFS